MPKNKIAIFFSIPWSLFLQAIYIQDSITLNIFFLMCIYYVVFIVNIYFGDFFYRPNGVKLCIFSMLYALILAIFSLFPLCCYLAMTYH